MPKHLFLPLLLAAILLSPANSYAQHDALTAALDELATKIQRVEAGSDTYDQSIKFDQERPWKLSFRSSITDKKGNTKEVELSFNLADIDKNTVRYETKKDIIQVELRTGRKQKFIQVSENGNTENYTSDFAIMATDVDNAREIEENFKAAIDAIGDGNAGLPNVPTFDGQMEWMASHVKSVSNGEETYEQRWEREDGHPTRCKLTTVETGKKSTETVLYAFNLADFGEHTIRMEVKGKNVFINAKIRRNEKFVEVWTNGQRDKYDDQIMIFTNGIDEARNLLYVLEQLVKSSEGKTDKASPKDAPLSEVLQSLNKHIGTVDAGGDSYVQTLTPDCRTTLTIKETNEKNEKEEQYFFHFGDLRPTSVDVKVSGNEIAVQAKSDERSKLVQTAENGEAGNFTADIKLYASGVENMRQLRQLLPAAIEGCAQQLKMEMETLEKADSDPLTFLSARVGDFSDGDNERRQALSKIEGDCKWRLSIIEDNGKKTEEGVWEFNNNDIDPSSLEFDISKKSIFVTARSKKKEKIIKYYENGEPDDYANELKVQVKDVEQGRALITVWKKAIEMCDAQDR